MLYRNSKSDNYIEYYIQESRKVESFLLMTYIYVITLNSEHYSFRGKKYWNWNTRKNNIKVIIDFFFSFNIKLEGYPWETLCSFLLYCKIKSFSWSFLKEYWINRIISFTSFPGCWFHWTIYFVVKVNRLNWNGSIIYETEI